MAVPLEKRVKGLQPRGDFASDAAHEKYLNGIAGLVFMQFKEASHAESAMVEKAKTSDDSAGGGP